MGRVYIRYRRLLLKLFCQNNNWRDWCTGRKKSPCIGLPSNGAFNEPPLEVKQYFKRNCFAEVTWKGNALRVTLFQEMIFFSLGFFEEFTVAKISKYFDFLQNLGCRFSRPTSEVNTLIMLLHGQIKLLLAWAAPRRNGVNMSPHLCLGPIL